MTAVSRENADLSGFPLPTRLSLPPLKGQGGFLPLGSLSQLLSAHAPSPELTGHPGQASSAISTPVQGRLPAPIPLWDPWRLLLQLLEDKLEADFSPSALAACSTRHKMSNINAKSVSIIQRQSANPVPSVATAGPGCSAQQPCPAAACGFRAAPPCARQTSFLLLLHAELPD